jgi:hypothetical protein
MKGREMTRAATHRLLSASAAGGKRIRVVFDDGSSKAVDVASLLNGSVFARIAADDEAFAELFVDPPLGTVCWPGDIDLAPEVFVSLPAVPG